MNYSEQMAKYGYVPANHDQPKWYPVALRDTYTDTGEKVPGYKAIQNQDTREIVHVATDSYTLVPHESWDTAFRLAIEESKLPTDNMLIGLDSSHNGCRAFGTFVLPEISEEINGTQIALTLGWGNSYDGSMACNVYGGHLNFNCNNLARNGHMVYSRRHVGEINVEEIVENLLAAAEAYHGKMIAMKEWPNKQLTDSHAVEIFGQLPGTNKRLQGELLVNWLKAKEDSGPNGGSTLWSAYNVLTAWSTHGDGFRESTKAYARANRQERVAELIELDTWQVLAA